MKKRAGVYFVRDVEFGADRLISEAEKLGGRCVRSPASESTAHD